MDIPPCWSRQPGPPIVPPSRWNRSRRHDDSGRAAYSHQGPLWENDCRRSGMHPVIGRQHGAGQEGTGAMVTLVGLAGQAGREQTGWGGAGWVIWHGGNRQVIPSPTTAAVCRTQGDEKIWPRLICAHWLSLRARSEQEQQWAVEAVYPKGNKTRGSHRGCQESGQWATYDLGNVSQDSGSLSVFEEYRQA